MKSKKSTLSLFLSIFCKFDDIVLFLVLEMQAFQTNQECSLWEEDSSLESGACSKKTYLKQNQNQSLSASFDDVFEKNCKFRNQHMEGHPFRNVHFLIIRIKKLENLSKTILVDISFRSRSL